MYPIAKITNCNYSELIQYLPESTLNTIEARLVPTENDWKQKRNDVIDYKVDVVVMGSDWENNENFECLRDICEVIYLPRTEGISTTKIKKDLGLKEESNSNNSSYILKK